MFLCYTAFPMHALQTVAAGGAKLWPVLGMTNKSAYLAFKWGAYLTPWQQTCLQGALMAKTGSGLFMSSLIVLKIKKFYRCANKALHGAYQADTFFRKTMTKVGDLVQTTNKAILWVDKIYF